MSNEIVAQIPYLQDFREVGTFYSIDWSLLAAIAKVESNFNVNAVSSAGARGMMQMTPVALKDIKETDVATTARGQIEQAAKYLHRLKTHTPPYDFAPWHSVLAAYVWGVGNVAKNPNPQNWPAVVCRYVLKVQFWDYIYRRQKIKM